MREELNFMDYDSISLALKEKEFERMLSYYASFGWVEYERSEDKRYFDIVHTKLKRQHKIANKDRLQLLQVKMEAEVNRFALVRKNKHSRSIITALSLGIFALALVSLGIWLLISRTLAPLAIALCALGVISPIVTVPFVKRTVAKENARFAKKFKEMTSRISRILSEAKRLSGVENEK